MSNVQTTRVQTGRSQVITSRSGLMAIVVVVTLITGPVGLGDHGLLPSASAATSHVPIHITDNADLAAQAASEGWPGTGTDSDPYVISGYAIDATNAPGIQLDRTSKHVVIRDNVIDGALSSYGIWLNRSHNVQIENNLVHDASFGIFIDGAENVHIRQNEVTNSFWGILVISSTKNTITDNEVHGNQNGIIGLTVWDNDFEANHAHDNTKRGIYLDDGRGNRIRDNLVTANTEIGIHLRRSYDNVMEGNRVDDHPDGILSDDSHDNAIRSNHVTGGTNGIRLYKTVDTAVASNHLSGSTYGVFIGESERNLLTANHAEGATTGFRLSLANDNTLNGDSANDTVTGMSLWNSLRNVIGGADLTNSTTGIQVEASRAIQVNNTTFTDNDIGLRIASSRESVFRDNVLTQNTEGIELRFGNTNTVHTNHVKDNGIGIRLHMTARNVIYDNAFANADNVRSLDSDDNAWNVPQTAGTNIIGGDIIGGNHWHDYTGLDLDQNGVGDLPHTPVPPVHPSVDGVLQDVGVTQGVHDELPLVDALLLLGSG